MSDFEREPGARVVGDVTVEQLVSELCYVAKTAAAAVGQQLGALVDLAVTRDRHDVDVVQARVHDLPIPALRNGQPTKHL